MDGPRAVTAPDFAVAAQPPDLAAMDLSPPSPDLVPSPDLGGCPGRPCDLVCQDCSRGSKCTLDGKAAPACLDAGTALPGHACTAKGADDCSAGALCLAAALSGAGACFRYCRTSADCPGSGVCAIHVQDTQASVCTEPVSACAIVPTSVGCSAGTSCYPVNEQGQTVSTISLGEVKGGQMSFELGDYAQTPPLPAGKYTYKFEVATDGGQWQAAKTYTAGRITGMRYESGNPILIIGDSLSVPMSQLTQVRS